MPPSCGSSKSTETTVLVNKPTKDLRLISPPWRQGSFRIHIATSTDSSVVDNRDRYQVATSFSGGTLDEIEERRDQEDNQEDDTSSIPVESSTIPRQDIEKLPAIKTVDSLELVSYPPPVREKKGGILSRIRKKVAQPVVYSRLDSRHDAVEVYILVWNEDKVTVQIADGRTKTKVRSSRQKGCQENAKKKKSKARATIEDHESRSSSNKSIQKKNEPFGAFFGDDKDDIEGESDESKHEETQVTEEEEEDEESLATIGPDDIPHTISYRTKASISSFVFSEIPPAASLPDMSDVSSSSSEASSWSTSSSEESIPPVNHGEMVVHKKNWNKKLGPVVRHLARPVTKMSSPLRHAFKKSDSFH